MYMNTERINEDELSITKGLFGGTIDFVVYTLAKNEARQIVEEAYKEALRLQKIFNFYDEASELSVLNRKRVLHVSEDLGKVIRRALHVSALTEGRYDITLGKAIAQRKKGEEITQLGCSYKDVHINGNLISLKHGDAMIDLGSIAKGYITDKIAEFLQSNGLEEFVIDSRGDILVSGKRQHVLEIQHPRDKQKSLGSVEMTSGGIATSGDYKQFHKNFEDSHLLNANDLISVTVIASTLAEADLHATAIFVAKKKDRACLLDKNKDIRAFLVDKKLRVKTFNNFEEFTHGKQ